MVKVGAAAVAAVAAGFDSAAVIFFSVCVGRWNVKREEGGWPRVEADGVGTWDFRLFESPEQGQR